MNVNVTVFFYASGSIVALIGTEKYKETVVNSFL
jgi:hypothetical protein